MDSGDMALVPKNTGVPDRDCWGGESPFGRRSSGERCRGWPASPELFLYGRYVVAESPEFWRVGKEYCRSTSLAACRYGCSLSELLDPVRAGGATRPESAEPCRSRGLLGLSSLRTGTYCRAVYGRSVFNLGLRSSPESFCAGSGLRCTGGWDRDLAYALFFEEPGLDPPLPRW